MRWHRAVDSLDSNREAIDESFVWQLLRADRRATLAAFTTPCLVSQAPPYRELEAKLEYHAIYESRYSLSVGEFYSDLDNNGSFETPGQTAKPWLLLGPEILAA